MSNKTTMQKLRGLFILVVIATAGLWAVYQWVWPALAAPFIDLATLRQEIIVDHTTVEALVVREETVIRAPTTGLLQPDIGGGERVSRGTGLGVVRGPAAGVGVCAPHAGVVFWSVDGLEEVLQAGSVLPSDTVPGLRPVQPHADEEVAKGEPLCRVVDNLGPIRLHFNIPTGVMPQPMLREGEHWCLLLDGQEYTGQVTEVVPEDDIVYAELLLGLYPDLLLRERRAPCAVVTRRMAGFIVPRRAIVIRAGESGIYLVCKNRVEWRPVRVEGQLGPDVQITGEALTEGCRYVANPWSATDGRSLPKGAA